MRITTALLLATLFSAGIAGCSQGSGGDVHIQDIHGLALDPNNPSILYVATHHGLFVGEDDARWAAVTEEPFDMMGFSVHTTDGRIMYASGHPGRAGQGWAVGLVRSTDAGRTWTTVGLKNQVDFHAMAMEPGAHLANDTVYGVHGGKLHVSRDGGATWTTRSLAFSVASLAVAPLSGDLWAATPQGVQRTAPGGEGAWRLVNPAAASAVAANPATSALVVHFNERGLAQSTDSGATWTSLNWTVPADDFPWGIALNPDESDAIYVGTARGTIHKTSNGGAAWSRVR